MISSAATSSVPPRPARRARRDRSRGPRSPCACAPPPSRRGRGPGLPGARLAPAAAHPVRQRATRPAAAPRPAPVILGARPHREDDARLPHRDRLPAALLRRLSAVTAGVKDVRTVVEDARRRLATGGEETVLHRRGAPLLQVPAGRAPAASRTVGSRSSRRPRRTRTLRQLAPVPRSCSRSSPSGTTTSAPSCGAPSGRRARGWAASSRSPTRPGPPRAPRGRRRARRSPCSKAAAAPRCPTPRCPCPRRPYRPKRHDAALPEGAGSGTPDAGAPAGARRPRRGGAHRRRITGPVRCGAATATQHATRRRVRVHQVDGSDVDASLHYLARIIAAGRSPRFIARRIVIAAAEDVGMADPRRSRPPSAAAPGRPLIGMPEGRIVLAEAVVHLATAPKSNAAYLRTTARSRTCGPVGRGPSRRTCMTRTTRAPSGWGAAQAAGTRTMRRTAGVAAQQYLPDSLVGSRYYTPTDRGYKAAGHGAPGASATSSTRTAPRADGAGTTAPRVRSDC